MSSSASQERSCCGLPLGGKEACAALKGLTGNTWNYQPGASLIQGKGRSPAGSVHRCCSRPRARADPQQLPHKLTGMPGMPVISKEIITNRHHYSPSFHSCLHEFIHSLSQSTIIYWEPATYLVLKTLAL